MLNEVKHLGYRGERNPFLCLTQILRGAQDDKVTVRGCRERNSILSGNQRTDTCPEQPIGLDRARFMA
jgi:hypothetical protein